MNKDSETENKIKIVLSGMNEVMKDLDAELAEFCSEIEAELEALEQPYHYLSVLVADALDAGVHGQQLYSDRIEQVVHLLSYRAEAVNKLMP